MLRRTVITLLTLAALTTAVLSWTGYATPIYWGYSVSECHHCYICFADGLVRLSCSIADEAIYLTPSPYRSWIGVHRSANDNLCLQIRHIRPAPAKRFDYQSRTYGPLRGSTAPTIQVRGLRMDTGVPMTLFLAYPFIAFVHTRYRRFRHRSGHCLSCEYDLTGNTSGVCPECGWRVGDPIDFNL